MKLRTIFITDISMIERIALQKLFVNLFYQILYLLDTLHNENQTLIQFRKHGSHLFTAAYSDITIMLIFPFDFRNIR